MNTKGTNTEMEKEKKMNHFCLFVLHFEIPYVILWKFVFIHCQLKEVHFLVIFSRKLKRKNNGKASSILETFIILAFVNILKLCGRCGSVIRSVNFFQLQLTNHFESFFCGIAIAYG